MIIVPFVYYIMFNTIEKNMSSPVLGDICREVLFFFEGIKLVKQIAEKQGQIK